MSLEKPYPERFEIDETVQNEHVELAKKISANYREHSFKLIEYSLGYLPAPYIYLPHLALAQSINENHVNGIISDDTHAIETFALCQRIRNDDMKKNGWVRYLHLDQDYLDFYNSHLGIYKDVARQRLCSFMGYEPLLIYSLPAEVLLRQLFESDELYSDMPMHQIDFRAITIARYREVLIVQGEQQADESDLMGLKFGAYESQKRHKK